MRLVAKPSDPELEESEDVLFSEMLPALIFLGVLLILVVAGAIATLIWANRGKEFLPLPQPFYSLFSLRISSQGK
jgi:hypothetical protein